VSAARRSAVASKLAHEEKRTLLALWIGILVPPAAWSVHLLLGYLLVALACRLSWTTLVLGLLLHGLTLVLTAVTVGSIVVVWRTGRDAGVPGDASDDERERRSFMVHMATFLSALFLLLILAGDIPNFFVPPCGSGEYS
jgi:small-conductance mechanosensitive channel